MDGPSGAEQGCAWCIELEEARIEHIEYSTNLFDTIMIIDPRAQGISLVSDRLSSFATPK